MTAPLEALRESLTHWRKTKHPRFADLAEWSTARALAADAPRPLVGAGKKKADVESWRALLKGNDPLDLPRLVKAIGGGTSAEAAERITLLSKLNDPRVTTGLLQLLGAPPYRARTALGFFRAAAKALQDSGDPRVRPALEELAARYKSILETSVGDDVAALLSRTAKAIDQVKPGPLPAALEQKAVALEALFEAERLRVERGAVKQQAAKHDDDALLAAIYAAPEDDGPRLVFADALSERGDARGEFIALQVNRAKGKATPAQLTRERELIGDAKRRAAWSLPLSRGAGCHLERGFPDLLVLEPRTFKTIIGERALATVHAVTGFDRDVSVKQAAAFLTHEHAARLRSVTFLEEELVEKLPTPLPWPSVGVRFLPGASHRALLSKVRDLRIASHLTVKTLGGYEYLEALEAGEVEKGVLPGLVGLRELLLNGWMNTFPWDTELTPLARLRRLELRAMPTPAQLEGLGLETLIIHSSVDADPAGLIAALPKLTELRIDRSEGAVKKVLADLFTSKRLSQLRFASVGNFEFTRPGTPEGTLELRVWNRAGFEKHAESVALLPEGCVSKVVVRPRSSDPSAYVGVAPEDAVIAALRAASKVPVELAWY